MTNVGKFLFLILCKSGLSAAVIREHMQYLGDNRTSKKQIYMRVSFKCFASPATVTNRQNAIELIQGRPAESSL